MKTLILSVSIIFLIFSHTPTLADPIESRMPTIVAQLQNPQLQSEGANIVSLGDVEAAKASMEQIRNMTAQDLIVALASVADFQYERTAFESLWIENDNVILSGFVRNESIAACQEKFSQLRNELEKHLKSVQVIGQEDTPKGLRFALKLYDAGDFIDCLTSQKTDSATPASQHDSIRQGWRKAEEEKRKAKELLDQGDYNAAEKAYEQTQKLFSMITHSGDDADAIQRILELQYSVANLNGELQALQTTPLPDTIVFKDGHKIQCEITAETADSIRINTETGPAVVPRNEIDSVNNVSQGSKQQKQKLETQMQEMQKQMKAFKPVLAHLQNGLLALLRNNAAESN